MRVWSLETALRPLFAFAAARPIPRSAPNGKTALDLETEDALVRACARSDETALARIYDRYAPLAYAIALRVCGDPSDAEEAVVDAFLDLWRSAGRFERGRGALSTWLGTMVRNRAIDGRRRSSRRRRDGFELREDNAVVDGDVAERVDVRAALATLGARQRSVLELAYFGGLTQREIAAHLRIPLGSVKSATWRGLEALRGLLVTFDRH